jgi:hypothetical protein
MATIPRQMPAFFLGLPPLVSLFKGKAARAGAGDAARDTGKQAARPAGTWPARPVHGATVVPDTARLLAAAKVAPHLALIEWDGDGAHSAARSAADGTEGAPFVLDPRQRKIRERYVTARFPGAARSLADLESADRVIKAARLYFEEDEPGLALELLELAAQEVAHESPVWLARLEILFLLRDRDGFVQAAHAFRGTHPRHEAWPEVERLGRALAPGDPLFGAVSGPREHEHYGPWPHTPNWIRAPWDLTGDIAAADFHRCARRLAGRPAGANA